MPYCLEKNSDSITLEKYNPDILIPELHENLEKKYIVYYKYL